MNVSGSSPLSSTTTLTSNPSATSSSHDRAAAPWPGGVRIEAEHDLRREPPQQLRLLRRQRRAARGDAGAACDLEHLREIEIPLDQDGEPELPDGRLRQVQAVQRPALRIDWRLRRVQILRPALVGVHLPAAERDDRAGVATPANLVRADGLEIFGLELHLVAGQLAQLPRREEWRALDVRRDAFARGLKSFRVSVSMISLRNRSVGGSRSFAESP